MKHTQPKPILAVRGVVAVDFETFYSKDYSIRDLGTYGYCHHEQFDAYLVSIYGYDNDGNEIKYVGRPDGYSWGLIADLIWVSHNKGFDSAVYARLREDDEVRFPRHTNCWHCSANLAVYLGAPRNLGGAALHLLGRKVDKTIRDVAMKGKKWSEFGSEMQEAVRLYALEDAINSYLIWAYYSEEWPVFERRLSEATYAMGDRGVAVNIEAIDMGIKALGTAMYHAELQIPWRHDHALLSPKQFAIACRAIGIVPPASLSMSNEDTDAWFEQYGDKAPFAQAMRTWRRANALREKLITMKSRVMENGRMSYSLLYGGAHTMRWSGSGGFNMQNISRSSQYLLKSGALEMNGPVHRAIAKKLKAGATVDELEFEINVRSNLVAAEGKKFVVADYAQIEARITPWVAGDTETLALCEKGMSIYEVHARRFMGWTGGRLKDEDPALYLLAKARVLALGFGAGHLKFLFMAGLYIDDPVIFDQIFGAAVSDDTVDRYIQSQTWMWSKDNIKVVQTADFKRAEAKRLEWLAAWQALPEQERRYRINAWLQVCDFRESNPAITEIWKRLDARFKDAASRGEDFTITLPSGRKLHYFDLRVHENGGVVARTEMGGPEHYFYGGKLFENLVQAIARDVIGEAIIRIEDAGIDIVLHVHDEIISEVADDFDSSIIAALMKVRPSWAQTLPIDVEYKDTYEYIK